MAWRAGGLLASLLLAPGVAVVDIGDQKQLLVDEHLLASVDGAEFVMHTPELQQRGMAPLLKPDAPWEKDAHMFINLYASVLPRQIDAPDSEFMIWYEMLSGKQAGQERERTGVVAYAEIGPNLTAAAVTKPILRQHTWGAPGVPATDENNFLAGLSAGWNFSTGSREGCSVWRDPLRSLGGEFVSQAILSSKMNGSVTGLAFSTSDDGVHGWRDVALSEEGPFDTGGRGRNRNPRGDRGNRGQTRSTSPARGGRSPTSWLPHTQSSGMDGSTDAQASL